MVIFAVLMISLYTRYPNVACSWASVVCGIPLLARALSLKLGQARAARDDRVSFVCKIPLLLRALGLCSR